jgi:hypothetical protein
MSTNLKGNENHSSKKLQDFAKKHTDAANSITHGKR